MRVAAAGEPIRIADARVRSFLQDDWAVRELGIIAYAGVPITTPDGYVLGAPCVIDGAVRIWTDDEVALLWDLAAIAQHEIQLRQRVDEQQRLEAQLLRAQKEDHMTVLRRRPLQTEIRSAARLQIA